MPRHTFKKVLRENEKRRNFLSAWTDASLRSARPTPARPPPPPAHRKATGVRRQYPHSKRGRLLYTPLPQGRRGPRHSTTLPRNTKTLPLHTRLGRSTTCPARPLPLSSRRCSPTQSSARAWDARPTLLGNVPSSASTALRNFTEYCHHSMSSHQAVGLPNAQAVQISASFLIQVSRHESAIPCVNRREVVETLRGLSVCSEMESRSNATRSLKILVSIQAT